MSPVELSEIFAHAERHGIAECLREALAARGANLPPSLAEDLGTRGAARSLDHEAHLALLRKIDDVLSGARLSAVALKGPLLAERLYPTPWARATSDVDLLVAERDLEAAIAALARVGYEASRAPEEARFRREHHHLHLHHPHALPLELHFHAYRGFGRTLRSEPLLARASAFPALRAIRVLAPDDELVYLAVHAAAHRFVRLGWLFDLDLLLQKLDDEGKQRALGRARALGFAPTVTMALRLVAELFGSAHGLVHGEPADDGSTSLRIRLARRLVGEPEGATARSATRFVYTTLLCDSWTSAGRYAAAAVARRLDRIVAGG